MLYGPMAVREGYKILDMLPVRGGVSILPSELSWALWLLWPTIWKKWCYALREWLLPGPVSGILACSCSPKLHYRNLTILLERSGKEALKAPGKAVGPCWAHLSSCPHQDTTCKWSCLGLARKGTLSMSLLHALWSWRLSWADCCSNS